ncbi:MAG: ATP-binding protein [Candidatus Eisenbacteria bacterium]
MSTSRIVIASGKGGSGKTTVATALVMTLMREMPEVQLVDCDVEGPDAALFLKPEIESSTPLTIDFPEIAASQCSGCGDCQSVCQFGGVSVVSGVAEHYSDLCHACGGCSLACHAGAITEKKKRIGVIESGRRENVVFHRGVLDVGRHMVTPIIRGLKSIARGDLPTILDSGPGTVSPVIATIKDCDYCILVTEPSPFGLYDLRIAVRLAGEIGVPTGIVINKDEAWSSNIEQYASEMDIPIILRIPFRREIASLCSRGIPLTEVASSWDEAFWDMYARVERTIWESRPRSPL